MNESTWLCWWMYRAKLTANTHDERRCAACDVDIAGGAQGYVLRPSDWFTEYDDSLDAVEAILALEERLHTRFADVDEERGPPRFRDICSSCESRYRDRLEWRTLM